MRSALSPRYSPTPGCPSVPDRLAARGRGGRGGQHHRLVVGAGQLARGRGLLDGDQLGALLDLRDDVGAAAALGRHVEGLDGLVAVLDQQPEALRGALALRVGDLDGERAAGAGRDGRHLERAELLGLAGRQGGRRGAAADGRGAVALAARHPAGRAAHPDDVRGGAAVVEESVDRVREEVSVGELTEGRDVLRPVGHQRRLVERPFRRESDEGGHRGAHPLDRARAAGDFLHVYARRQVRRHARFSSGYETGSLSTFRPRGPRGNVLRCLTEGTVGVRKGSWAPPGPRRGADGCPGTGPIRQRMAGHAAANTAPAGPRGPPAAGVPAAGRCRGAAHPRGLPPDVPLRPLPRAGPRP